MTPARRLDLLIAALLLVLVGVAVWIDQQPEPPMKHVGSGSMR